jgi:hypothetical protein
VTGQQPAIPAPSVPTTPRKSRFKFWYLIPVALFVIVFLIGATLFVLEYTGVTDWFVDDIDDIF